MGRYKTLCQIYFAVLVKDFLHRTPWIPIHFSCIVIEIDISSTTAKEVGETRPEAYCIHSPTFTICGTKIRSVTAEVVAMCSDMNE